VVSISQPSKTISECPDVRAVLADVIQQELQLGRHIESRIAVKGTSHRQSDRSLSKRNQVGSSGKHDVVLTTHRKGPSSRTRDAGHRHQQMALSLDKFKNIRITVLLCQILYRLRRNEQGRMDVDVDVSDLRF
jgi:hypothetical protein